MFVSETYSLYDCTFYDTGKSDTKNTNWLNYSNRLTITPDNEGTLITCHATSNGYYFVSNGQFIFSDYICEFDVISIQNAVQWYHQTNTSPVQLQNVVNLTSYAGNGSKVKLVCEDGVLSVYVDNVLKTSVTLTTTELVEVGFRLDNMSSQQRQLKYKEFKIYPI